MKFLFALIFLISISLSADKDDEIIITTKVHLPIYSQAKDSYCKQRDTKENVIWKENFSNSALSEDNWSYATGNGFKYKGQYISGWGNSELQYYRKGMGETFTNANLFIEEGLLKIQPIFHKKGFKGCLLYTSDAADE